MCQSISCEAASGLTDFGDRTAGFRDGGILRWLADGMAGIGGASVNQLRGGEWADRLLEQDAGTAEFGATGRWNGGIVGRQICGWWDGGTEGGSMDFWSVDCQ